MKNKVTLIEFAAGKIVTNTEMWMKAVANDFYECIEEGMEYKEKHPFTFSHFHK